MKRVLMEVVFPPRELLLEPCPYCGEGLSSGVSPTRGGKFAHPICHAEKSEVRTQILSLSALTHDELLREAEERGKRCAVYRLTSQTLEDQIRLLVDTQQGSLDLTPADVHDGAFVILLTQPRAVWVGDTGCSKAVVLPFTHRWKYVACGGGSYSLRSDVGGTIFALREPYIEEGWVIIPINRMGGVSIPSFDGSVPYGKFPYIFRTRDDLTKNLPIARPCLEIHRDTPYRPDPRKKATMPHLWTMRDKLEDLMDYASYFYPLQYPTVWGGVETPVYEICESLAREGLKSRFIDPTPLSHPREIERWKTTTEMRRRQQRTWGGEKVTVKKAAEDESD